MKRDTKIILALSLIAFLAVGTFGLFSWWGAGELTLTTSRLEIDGGVMQGGNMQVIVWDKDGSLRYDSVSNIYVGHQYPTVRFTVGNLRAVSSEPYDVFNHTTQINATHIKADVFAVWKYQFDVFITFTAKSDVVKNVRSAFEGRFAAESPWQGVVFDFIAVARLSMEPYAFSDVQEGYGLMWLQISPDYERILHDDPNLDSQISTTLVKYQAEGDLANIGYTWGYQYSANDLLGKDLPASAEIGISGSAIVGSYCYYDPQWPIDIPGDLYAVKAIYPEFRITVNALIGGHKLYIIDQSVPNPIEPTEPAPPIPPGPNLVVLIIVGILVLAFLIFAAPRLIKSSRGK